jgi:hypothetical protein
MGDYWLESLHLSGNCQFIEISARGPFVGMSMSLYSIPSKKMAQAKGLRHVFFTLYIQNIKSKGAIWTFFQNYYFHPNQ